MRKHSKKIGLSIVVALLLGAIFALVMTRDFAVLAPAGTIARQQRDLLLAATLLMLLIVIPVFILTFYIAWKYRASNTRASYQPEWDHNTRLEALWWGLPCIIISILAVMAWNTSHSLDPARAIQSDKKPLTIQVIALQWKWLFIYPEQQVASVNSLHIPTDRPVDFEITADAPMNSFWIPQLGGQIYAMAGMTTRLHLMADKPGVYHGSSANLSGTGFAAMRFTAEATNESEFNRWVALARSSQHQLGLGDYSTLAQPTTVMQKTVYGSYESGLYNTVIMKYMAPHTTPEESHDHASGSSHHSISDSAERGARHE